MLYDAVYGADEAGCELDTVLESDMTAFEEKSSANALTEEEFTSGFR